MKAKKIYLLILGIIIISVTSACSSSKECSMEEMEFEIPYNNYTYDICTYKEDKFLVVDKDKIHVFNNNGKLEKTYNYDNVFFTGLCMDEYFIYSFDIANMELNKINIETGMIDSVIPLDIPSITNPESILKMRKVDKFLFMLTEDSAHNAQRSLEKINMKERTTTHIAIDNVIAFSTYTENKILVAYSENYSIKKLCLYDFEICNKERTWDFNNKLDNFEYDKTCNRIYYSFENEIFTADFKEFHSEYAGTFIKSKNHVYFTGLSLSENYIFVLGSNNGNMKRFPKKDSYNTKKLTVSTFVNGHADLPDFSAKYPDVHIDYNYIPMGEINEKLKVKLLSRDSSFDIYQIQLEAHQYIKNSLFIDLRKFDALQKRISNLIPSLQKACTYKEQIFGIPTSFMFELLFYNKSRIEEANIKLQDIVTWDDIIKINDRISCAPAAEPIVRKLFFQEYLINYCNLDKNQINFDTPVFRYILGLLKQMKNNNMFSNRRIMPKSFDEVILHIDAGFFRKDRGKENVGYSNNIMYTGVPCIDREEGNLLPMTMSWLIINPKSNNVNIAADYLDIKLEYYTKFYPKRIPEPDLKEEDRIYRKVLKRSRIFYYTGLYREFEDIMKQFYSEAISIDETIEKISDKVKMILAD